MHALPAGYRSRRQHTKRLPNAPLNTRMSRLVPGDRRLGGAGTEGSARPSLGELKDLIERLRRVSGRQRSRKRAQWTCLAAGPGRQQSSSVADCGLGPSLEASRKAYPLPEWHSIEWSGP